VGVLGAQQHPNDPAVQPEDPHQARPSSIKGRSREKALSSVMLWVAN
jgi:hypothetical protein